MVPNNCCYCNGKRKTIATDFVVKANGDVIVIKNVPTLVCETCGEQFHSLNVARKIDYVMKLYHTGMLSKIKSNPINAREIPFPKKKLSALTALTA